MKRDITTLRWLGVLIVTLVLAACATQKSRHDQSKIGKIYHDVTAKYNGYFNANEIIEESVVQLDGQHQDNYNEVLALYKYRAAPNPEAVAANLDEAIKKVSVVATLHENSQWIDDCYLLIGKAYYLKQDFESAENALEFFIDEFHPDGTRITRKARRQNPNAKKTRTKASIDNARKKSARAKAAERERKQYNKQVRKNKKNSARKGGSSINPPERKTARDVPPPPTQVEPVTEPKKPQSNLPGTGDQNPGGLKHKPAHQLALLWLARTYVERENYPGAERMLNGLRNNVDLQEEVKKELPVVWAYYAIKRKNYTGAIPHLESAVELADKKAEKARLAFIIAQIAEMEKNFDLAAQYYELALKNNPDYTLAFNARLNMVRAKMEAGGYTTDEIVQTLERMLKDEKNVDFKDQIYFALAQLALKQNDIPAAIENLELAAESGSRNTAQLTETNYLLAELYFQTADYVNAKAAYDATLTTMLKTDARYRQVDRLSKNLTDIARYLNDIALQDSLLAISAMDENARLELAKRLQKDANATAKNASAAKSQNVQGKGGPTGGAPAMPAGAPQSRPTSGQSAPQSTFFAYLPKELKRGQREFENDWGDRGLGDNWRVSSIAASGIAFDNDVADPNTAAITILTRADVDKIFRDVPDTDEKKAAAHETIQNAMLQLGSLYRDKLEDYTKSIETLEKLLMKYPDTKFALDVYYQLYVSHHAIGNHDQAEYYKNRIINEYAASKYALVLTDPDYLSKQLSEEQRLDRNYQEVYELVETGAFEEAKARIDEARQTFGNSHKLNAKYSILEAMCIGNLEGKEAYVDALKAVIGAYPGTPEETKARDMLLLLGEYKGSRLNLAKSTGPSFEPGPDAQHFILIQVTGNKVADAQDVKVSISNYNRKYHSLDKLKISSLRFDTQGNQVIILVRSFKDAATAMKYFDGANKYPAEFVPAGTHIEVFAVTQHNYREIVSQKSVDSYRSFFEEHYLKKDK